MSIIATYSNLSVKSQVEYIFNLILSIYGIDYSIVPYEQLSTVKQPITLMISYGKQEPDTILKNHIHIYESEFWGENYLKKASMPSTPLKTFGSLPIIYSGNGDLKEQVEKSNSTVRTNIDIIASSFFTLSRYEELVSSERDEFNRFPVLASLAYNEGFLDRPIVNEYMELLWSWIAGLGLGLKRKRLWDGRDFAVCLTHDVDKVKKTLRDVAYVLVRRRDIKAFLTAAINYLKVRTKLAKDPFDSFDYITGVEEKYGFSSSFHFIAGGTTRYERNYSVEDPKITHLIESLESRGFEIGLHPSFNCYKDVKMLTNEKQRLQRVLGHYINGTRQHYLRWSTPESWRSLEKAGIRYDSTLTFAEHEGFRCGICFPFQPFDILENRRLETWELPPTVMDVSLITYQRMTAEEGVQRIQNIIRTIKRYGGVFVLLWHNGSLDELMHPGWSKVYEETLEYLSKESCFCSQGRDIVRWWENNVFG
jgi:hypothetical protein